MFVECASKPSSGCSSASSATRSSALDGYLISFSISKQSCRATLCDIMHYDGLRFPIM